MTTPARPTDALPRELRTERLVIRAWRGDDAPELRPILLANQEHLKRWIPEHVYTAPPLPQLVERLDRFAAKFAAGVEYRYALRDALTGRIVGGMSLFPRDAAARVQLTLADRVELGYWLRSDATGQGLITEASRALLAVAATLPHLSHVEIRCDARNAPSAAIPKRLGFTLAEEPAEMQVWVRSLADFERA